MSPMPMDFPVGGQLFCGCCPRMSRRRQMKVKKFLRKYWKWNRLSLIMIALVYMYVHIGLSYQLTAESETVSE